jgi:transposase InsO family protein
MFKFRFWRVLHMQLVVNDLLLSKHDSNKLERIVWIDNENGWCYLININKPTFPYRLEANNIIQLLEIEEIEKVNKDPLCVLIQEADLTELELSKRDFAWRIIEYIYQPPDIFDIKSRSILIKSASDKFGVSRKTVRHYLKRFWARGMIKNALMPDYVKCGKKPVEERVYTKKTGRPTIYPSSFKRAVVNEEWKKIFRISIERHYFKLSKPSIKYAYQQMLKEYFSVQDKESAFKVLNMEKPVPSFDQFYYFYQKSYKPDYVIRKREGRRSFLQNHRAITGSATEDSTGIGMYACDGTIGDIYLVSSIDRTSVIGRPTIYLIVDIFSRCIVGLSVGIENMSGHSLRVALANTFENKREFCKRTLDMDINEEDWIAHYLPHSLLADRGSELISEELTSVVEDLNIKIQNTAPWRPELKGVCENYFNILQNNFLSPLLPGAVQKDFNKRGGKDYRKSAVLNLTEYTRILVRCIIYYNSHFLNDYPLTRRMIEEKIPPIPNEIFRWGLRKGTGQLRNASQNLIWNIYPKSKGLITAKGILFQGLYYTSSIAVKERWFSTARISGNWKIDIHFDPQNMSKIYIPLNRKDYEVCTLIDQYDMYHSAKIEEVIDLRRNKRQQEADYQEKELNSQIKLVQEIEEIVKKAKEETRIESINGHIHKNVKDIRGNRKEEQELLRKTKKLKDKIYVKESASSSLKQMKNIDLFRQKQKEGINYEDD